MKHDSITTQTSLANALECKQSQVSRWMRRTDWKFGKGPWKRSQIPLIQRWRAENLKPGAPEKPKPENTGRVSTLREGKLNAEVRKLNAQADEAETQLLRERKKLVPIGDVVAEWEKIGQRIRNDFRNATTSILPIALTLGMPMQASAEFQEKTNAIIEGILRVLSDAGRKQVDEVEEAA